MKFPLKTFFQDHCTHSVVKPIQNTDLDNFKTLVFSLITAQWQADSLCSNHKFDWHAEDQHLAFDEWKVQITLALRASSIKKDI